MTLPLVDSHCHFDFSEFDHDRENIWRDCKKNNITRLIIPGVSPETLSAAIDISEARAGIYFSVGLHPWWIKKTPALIGWDNFQPLITHKNCVAIGECGLDKFIETPLSDQINILKKHFNLAERFDLPLIIHNRKANNELLKIIDEYTPARGGVIHGFSGSFQVAEAFIQRGFLIGVGGTITYARASKTREAVKKLPLDKLLLETDAPDMPLWGHQGERNSPLYLLEVAKTLAEIRGQSLSEIISATTANAVNLFRLSYVN